MDYEKKYNEAIKRAKQHCADYVVETIFPELKESESDDERIRKELLAFAQDRKAKYPNYPKYVNTDAWIDWLKKQNQNLEKLKLEKGKWYFCIEDYHPRADCTDFYQGEKYRCEKDGVMGVWRIKNPEKYFRECEAPTYAGSDAVRIQSIIQVLEYARSLSAYNQFGKDDITKDIAWLEKQGKQQDVSIQINPSEYINDMGGNGCYLKSTDKIEPKFKEGDWVVYENRVGLIIRMLKEHYIISFDGVKEQVSFTFNDRITKWTIQDAKDGDVLCDYSEAYDNPLIFILKKFECVNFGLTRPSDYSSYCFLTAGDIQRFKEGTYHHKHNIEPATKEQRDTLERAMTKAGYRWDKEKLKLEKYERSVFATNRYR